MSSHESERVGGTFSGPDMRKMTRAILNLGPFSDGIPTELARNFSALPIKESWRAHLLESNADGLSASWGDHQRISRDKKAVGVSLPNVRLDPREIMEFFSSIPFEVCVMSPLDGHCWMDNYFAPAISAYHALLGWGAILKGAGHARFMSSRRWIDHGPWRVFRGPEDTTFIQFHELDIEAEASLPQARAAHDWMIRGYLRPDHPFEHDISGIYTAEDKLLRIVVPDREVTDRELHDACVARRNGRDDPDKPIENIAYIFMEESAARAHLDMLWLRGLECRTIREGREIRLDEHHSIERKVGWW